MHRTDSADLHFELAGPLIGRSPGWLSLSAFGEVRLEHRILESPVAFSIERIAAVARPEEAEQLPVLVRELARLDLPGDGVNAPNLVLVLRSPIHVGPFAPRARRALGLTGKQRKEGVEVDLLGLTVTDPGLLLDALAERGVSTSASLARALTASIPVASPEVAARVLEARRRHARRWARRQIAFGAFAALAVAVPAAAPSTWATSARLVVASLGAALLVGLAIAARGRVTTDRPARRWAALLAVAPLVFLGVLAILGVRDELAGAWYVLVWSALGATVGGPLIGVGLRALRATRDDETSASVIAAPGRRWGLGLLAATAAVAVVAGSMTLEHSAEGVVRSARAALVDVEDLPSGWEECCGADHVLRGDALDEHICGSDDDALPAHVAAARRSFNKPTAGDEEFLDAHLDVTVLRAPSVGAAGREFAAVNSAGYLRCTSRTVGELARYWQSRAAGEPRVEYSGRERISGMSHGLIDTFRVLVPVNDVLDVSWVHFVRMRVGSTIVRMPVQSMSVEPLDRAELLDIIQSVRGAVAAESR